MNVDYGKIINRSIELIKRNRWLWVYGLTLAVLSGGGGGNGGSSSRSYSSTQKNINLPKELPGDLPEKSSKVLGETISAFSHWVSTIPPANWVIIGVGFFVVLAMWVIISLIVKSWARGGLIAALEDADNEKPVTLASTSPRGLAAVKNLIILGLISFCITFGIIIAAILFVGGGYAIFSLVPPLNIIWLVISIVITVVSVIIGAILFAMIDIYAERLIVLKGFEPWDAWKKGLSLSKGNFLPTAVMGIINTAIGCVGGCLFSIVLIIGLGLPALALALPIFSSGQLKVPGIPAIAGLSLLFFAFFQLSTLMKAMFILFNYSNWNLLFKEVWQKEPAS